MPFVERLRGGVMNAGAVRRVGHEVVRPARSNSQTLHALLRHLRSTGFEGAPEALGIDDAGHEHLIFVAGDVPHPPYPRWAYSDEALASTATLLRGLHDATAGFRAAPDASWNEAQADANGGAVICHNDVRPDNVVFRDGKAVALIDFDFAAPGRRVFDIAVCALSFLPCEAPPDAARVAGTEPPDPFVRLRLLVETYGALPDREDVVVTIGERLETEMALLESEPVSDADLVARGGHKGYRRRAERRLRWFEQNRSRFLDELGEQRRG